MMVQISGQYGDPKADGLFWPIQKKLNDCFKKHVVGSYFNSIEVFSIVFRVSGKVRDFGSEGPERMKHNKKNSEITIDMVFPESCWRGVDKGNLKEQVASSVKDCLGLMTEKADTVGEVKDNESFNKDIDKAILEFLAN